MKEIETANKKVAQQLSPIEKRSGVLPHTLSKGTVDIEDKYGTIKFERRLKHPKEVVWQAITDQTEVFRWLSNYKGTFNGYKGGTIDLLNVVSGSRVTGKVLVFDLYHIFEHEWHIAPNQMFPKGEPESTIRWDLKQDSKSETLLTVTHSNITKSTALTFAPGWHAYLDRLEALLNNQVPPDWAHRFAEVKELY